MSTKSGHVMLVDDDPVFILLMSTALETAGHSVSVVEHTGLRKFLHSTEVTFVDLLLLDVNLPSFKGDTVAGSLMKREELPMNVPVFLLSGLPELELERRAAEARADGYICKGWGVERIVQCVDEALAKLAASSERG